jgi:hypothetical protein
MKELFQIELTEENLDVIFQALVKNYINSGKKDVPEVINSLMVQLVTLVVSRYSYMDTPEQKEQGKEFAKELYLTFQNIIAEFKDYMTAQQQEF